MKKSSVSAILLIFIVSFNYSYSSTILDENEAVSSTPKSQKVSPLKLPSLRANSLELNMEDNDKEIQLLENGLSNLKIRKVDEALSFFEQAINSYGSPLGYLYAGALTNESTTSQRYINIAQLAVNGKAIPQDIFDQHVTFLIKLGLLTIS